MIKPFIKKKLCKVQRYPNPEVTLQYIYMGGVKAVENGRYLWSEGFGAWRLNRADAERDSQSMIGRQDYQPRFY